MRRRSVIVLFAATLLGGVHLLSGGEQPAPQARPRLSALRQERVGIAKQALEVLDRQRNSGTGGDDGEFGQWEKRLFEAETAAAADKAGRVAAAERYVDATRKRVERAQRLYDAAVAPMASVLTAKYDLAGAECALEELKAQ
jgi:hypothetical protein